MLPKPIIYDQPQRNAAGTFDLFGNIIEKRLKDTLATFVVCDALSIEVEHEFVFHFYLHCMQLILPSQKVVPPQIFLSSSPTKYSNENVHSIESNRSFG